jgi:O-antigen/teichoic acid export membrane protein
VFYLLFVLIIHLLPQNIHLHAALLAYVVSPLVASIYVYQIIRISGKIIPKYITGLPWTFIKKGFVYAIALFILSLNYRVDIIILERLTSPYEVGIYSVGVNIADLLWLLPTALTAVNFSYSANATDPMEYAKKTAKILRITLWIGILPALLLFFLAPFIIPFFYGQEFQSSGTVVQAILPGVWMTLIFKILNSDLAGRGIPQAALWVYLFAVILNIILNIWWDPIFGAKGAAWASTVSYSVGAIIFLFTYSRISNVSISDLIIIQKKDIYGFIKV